MKLTDLSKNIKKLISIYQRPAMDQNEKRFVRHNESIWAKKPKFRSEGEILVEIVSPASSVVALSYFTNILSDKLKSKIVSYHFRKKSIFESIAFRKKYKIYKSFNTEIMAIDLSTFESEELKDLCKVIVPRIQSKKDVEGLTIDGVWIGDLLYDTHLKKYRIPTIDLEDQRFYQSLEESLRCYLYWRDYFKTHQVKAVVLSHCVYDIAIVLRVAVNCNVPCYQVHATHIYMLNQNNADKYHYRAYNDAINYKDEFKLLPAAMKRQGLRIAKERLDRRFSGEVGVDMMYSKKSAYANNIINDSLIKDSCRIKILVATHCFFDNPHPYGKSLFPDFYEWLEFLGKISKKTDYDWYIKMHPDFLPGNAKIIDAFIEKYDKFVLIPADTPHLQIIEEGIDVALTVHGTIGFEYAALGKIVINASMCNPHITYDFNLHPKSIEEYEKILINLSDLKLDIKKDEVYEYYFMKFIYCNTDNWLYNDYQNFLEDIGGYKKQFGSVAYSYFLKEFSEKKHKRIIRKLDSFIQSGKYRFI